MGCRGFEEAVRECRERFMVLMSDCWLFVECRDAEVEAMSAGVLGRMPEGAKIGPIRSFVDCLRGQLVIPIT